MCSHYIIIVFSTMYMLTDVDLAGRLTHGRKIPGSNPVAIEIVLNVYGVIALYSCGLASRFVVLLSCHATYFTILSSTVDVGQDGDCHGLVWTTLCHSGLCHGLIRQRSATVVLATDPSR